MYSHLNNFVIIKLLGSLAYSFPSGRMETTPIDSVTSYENVFKIVRQKNKIGYGNL